MGRYAILGDWIENEDGSESYAELEVFVTDPQPETPTDRPLPRMVDPCRLWLDGDEVEIPEHQELVNRLKAEPIPESDDWF